MMEDMNMDGFCWQCAGLLLGAILLVLIVLLLSWIMRKIRKGK